MRGVVTGLEAEARIGGRLGWALPGGGLPEGASRVARYFIGRGAQALISFGVAGGIDPLLVPGTIVIPGAVVTQDARFETDAGLSADLGGPTPHILFSGMVPAVTAALKAGLFARTGAHAIDLESGEVARLATAQGIPFAVLRAICDPADADLPPAALLALNGEGRIAFGRVLGSVLRHPGQVPDLVRLGRQAAAARDALLRHVRIVTASWSEALHQLD